MNWCFGTSVERNSACRPRGYRDPENKSANSKLRFFYTNDFLRPDSKDLYFRGLQRGATILSLLSRSRFSAILLASSVSLPWFTTISTNMDTLSIGMHPRTLLGVLDHIMSVEVDSNASVSFALGKRIWKNGAWRGEQGAKHKSLFDLFLEYSQALDDSFYYV